MTTKEIIKRKEQHEKQIQKCIGCEWGMKQENKIVCPFSNCIK